MKNIKHIYRENFNKKRFTFMAGGGEYTQRTADFKSEVNKIVNSIDDDLQHVDAKFLMKDANDNILKAGQKQESWANGQKDSKEKTAFLDELGKEGRDAVNKIRGNKETYEKKRQGYIDLEKATIEIDALHIPKYKEIQKKMDDLKAEQPADLDTALQFLGKRDEIGELYNDSNKLWGTYMNLEVSLKAVIAIGDKKMTEKANNQLNHVKDVLEQLPKRIKVLKKFIRDREAQYKEANAKNLKNEENILADLGNKSYTASRNVEAAAKKVGADHVDKGLLRKKTEAYKAYAEQRNFVKGLKDQAKQYQDYVFVDPKPIEEPKQPEATAKPVEVASKELTNKVKDAIQTANFVEKNGVSQARVTVDGVGLVLDKNSRGYVYVHAKDNPGLGIPTDIGGAPTDTTLAQDIAQAVHNKKTSKTDDAIASNESGTRKQG